MCRDTQHLLTNPRVLTLSTTPLVAHAHVAIETPTTIAAPVHTAAPQSHAPLLLALVLLREDDSLLLQAPTRLYSVVDLAPRVVQRQLKRRHLHPRSSAPRAQARR